MTAEELAQLCGVSRRAVHRALNGASDIAPKTRDRILEIARKHNYVPSSAGQILRTGRTNFLGFVAGNLHDPYYSYLTMNVIEEALKYGYQVVFSSTEWDMKKEAVAFRNIMAQKVDGMIYLPDISDEQRTLLPHLRKRKFPLVLSRPNNAGFPAVYPDYRHGFTELVTQLPEYRRIGFLMHKSDMSLKADIFCSVCEEYGVFPDVKIAENWGKGNGDEYCRLICQNPETKVWVISGENATVNVHLQLCRENFSVQLVALNGIKAFSLQNPPLWALSEDLGIKAKLLVELAIGKKASSQQEYLVPMKFMR